MRSVPNVRKALWHFRKGGLSQLHLYLLRNSLDGPTMVRKKRTSPKFEPYKLPRRQSRRSLCVGVIADTFTDLAFSFEWKHIYLTPDSWKTQIDSIELLFVEAAWHGNKDKWQYQLVGRNSPSQTLKDLVSACKAREIPTVFWNKEDPFHFDDFIETAGLFDWVFTTEEAVVKRYKEVLGHNRVGHLGFAAQPSIHNLKGRLPDSKLNDVSFAGTYFRHKFPERQEQISTLVGGAIDANHKLKHGLDIFARFNGLDPNYEFPEEFAPHIRGELSYEEMLTAYRSYGTFINVNSIPNSETMFSRRVYEILACGGAVISSPSPALTNTFGGSVLQIDDRNSATNWVRALSNSPALRDELAYKGRMKIYEKHTYSHRADQVLSAVGLGSCIIGKPELTILGSTNRPHQLRHMLEQLHQQIGVTIQPLVYTDGFSPTDEDREFAVEHGLDVVWVNSISGAHLGDKYNHLIDMADTQYVVKFDDDDDYGPYYLLEQVTSLEAMRADVVGKESHFLRLRMDGEEKMVITFPGREHRFTTFVSGPTIMARTEVAREVRFESRTRGEDTAFLRAVTRNGGRIWTTGRFGFIQNRLGQKHTWTIGADEILAYSSLTDSPL